MFFLFNKPEAEKDILEAASWYESQQSGLGNRFLDDLENLFSYIELNPYLFPEKYKDVRQAPMKKFPFVVLFRVTKNKIKILSVFNCYQHPLKKKSRLK